MRQYPHARDLPDVGLFSYTQGVLLSGIWQIGKLTGSDKYFRYVKDWMDSVISDDGAIIDYFHGDFDSMQPGILLFGLLDLYGEQKYREALDNVIAQLDDVPVGPTGGYWHKRRRNSQMWLDGLYMVGPFMSEYAKRFSRPDLANQVIFQAELMLAMTTNLSTGLPVHAWDARRIAPWADPISGRAPEHWGRAIGWATVALLDDADHFATHSREHLRLLEMASQILRGVIAHQSPEGRWYQVVDKPQWTGNWLENSSSSLLVSALSKALVKGYAPAEEIEIYQLSAQRGYQAIIDSLRWSGNDLIVGDICIGTGVGDYQFYVNRPRQDNDFHGIGAFLLMCSQVQQLENLGS
ncbi:MAG: glycoside hydrolase family 88 protein [Promicromonosporaceae bacterium]|nr:glycoside hydrolase family 88 protein [Promicromonosporaceae bacterium]